MNDISETKLEFNIITALKSTVATEAVDYSRS